VQWWQTAAPDGAPAHDGALLALVTNVSSPLIIAVLAVAARRARWPVAGYLGLVPFRVGDLLRGIVTLLALFAAFGIAAHLLGRGEVTRFQSDAYASARAAGALPWLWLAAVVLAPAAEEVTFRGFLFRGWARSSRQAGAVILLTAAAWSALHLQYDWFNVLQVFAIGVALGWLRWRSGSTTLTILLHALVNAAAMLETAARSG
jgi:membrane protease YdiL (CAAX protease family)